MTIGAGNTTIVAIRAGNNTIVTVGAANTTIVTIGTEKTTIVTIDAGNTIVFLWSSIKFRQHFHTFRSISKQGNIIVNDNLCR